MKKLKSRGSDENFAKSLKQGSREKNNAPSYGGPKTSEYKNYMQLREQIGKKISRLPQKQDKHLREFEGEFKRDRNDPLSRQIHFDIKDARQRNSPTSLSKPIGKLAPIGELASTELRSPLLHVESSRRGLNGVGHRNAFTGLTKLTKEVATGSTKSPVLFAESPRRAADWSEECKSENIFSRKRYKLLQLAATTLSTDIEHLLSERTDLISEFLQRQGIDNIGKNSGLCSNPREMYINTKNRFCETPLLDCRIQERSWTPEANHIEHTTTRTKETSWPEMGPLSISTRQAKSRVERHKRRRLEFSLDTRNTSYFFQSDACNLELNAEPSHDRYDCSPDIKPLQFNSSDSNSFRLCWHPQEDSYGVAKNSMSRELDRLYDWYQPEHPNEKSTYQFLCWHDKNEDNSDLSLMPFNMEMSLPSSSTFLENNQEWNLKRQVEAKDFSSQSFLPFCCYSNAWRPNLIQRIPFLAAERNLLENAEGAVRGKKIDYLPLVNTDTDYCPAVTENYKMKSILCSSRPLISLIHETSDPDLHLYTKTLVSKGHDSEVGQMSSLPAELTSANSVLPFPCHLSYHEKRVKEINPFLYPNAHDNQYTQAVQPTSEIRDVCKLSSFSLSISPFKERIIRKFVTRPPSLYGSEEWLFSEAVEDPDVWYNTRRF